MSTKTLIKNMKKTKNDEYVICYFLKEAVDEPSFYNDETALKLK